MERTDNVKLVRTGPDDAENLWKMQVEAFSGLYEKYHDTETSPATESLEKVLIRLEQPFTYYYYIVADGETVGAIRIVDRKDGSPKRVSPIFIMDEYRNRGYAQKAMQLTEKLHGGANWELDTLLQEKGNCYLYEKMGYRQTGRTEVINDRLTIVFYRKNPVRLQLRTRDNVRIYFRSVQDDEIKRFLPQKAKSEAEAVADFDKTLLLPEPPSFGRCIYTGTDYIGDVWAYCIGEDEPNAMLSFCIFDKSKWAQGFATEAVGMFIYQLRERYDLKTLGAFTYSDNLASIRVLQKNGFQEKETFVEDGRESKYFQRDFE